MQTFPNTMRGIEELRGSGLTFGADRPVLGKPHPFQHGVLRKDDWKTIDDAVVAIARDRLSGVQDLENAGLVLNLGTLGITTSEWEKQSDMTEANVSMSGVTQGEEDRLEFGIDRVPIPIIHKDFALNIRALEASRRGGTPLDTAAAQTATRRVLDAAETMLFQGTPAISSDSATIYGYLTAPNRNTVSTVASWATAANIYPSVLKMIEAAEADNFFGPYWLYLHKNQYAEMRAAEGVDKFSSVMERVLQLPQIAQIKASQACTDGSAVLVQPTSDVVDLAIGANLRTVQWTNNGGFTQHFKVMMAMAPRMKSDFDGRCGIVIHTNI